MVGPLWRKAHDQDLVLVRDLLREYAPDSCSLFDRMFGSSLFQVRPWHQNLWIFSQGQGIHGILWLNNYGLCLPLFRKNTLGISAAQELLRQNQGTPNPGEGLFALVGRTPDVIPFLESWASPKIHWRYTSLALPGFGAPESITLPQETIGPGPNFTKLSPFSSGGITIRQAIPSDISALLELERAYQAEEVLAPGMSFQPAGATEQLREQIRCGHLLVAQATSTLVGKAGINATGYGYLQVGGVFVVPPWRGNGIATALVSTMKNLVSKEGWGLSLFVRVENAPAIQVYKKVGFVVRGPFTIAYY